MKRSHKIKIKRVKAPDGNRPIEAAPQIQVATRTEQTHNGNGVRYALPPDFVKGMALIATNIWKARCRMIDPESGEAREELRRLSGDIERIQRCLNGLGIVVEDHTNKPFDYGLPWQVVATKPMPGLAREIVTETLKPTVRWNEQIIQHAEVEIGTPV